MPETKTLKTTPLQTNKHEGKPSQDPKTVLIVDDEPDFLLGLEQLLRSEHWEVISCTDPKKALSHLAEPAVDLVITDVNMPGMNGIEFCKNAKRDRPDVEVIVVTGAGTIQIAVDAMKAGAYDFLTKPFDHPEVAIRAASRALERRHLDGEVRYLRREVELTSRFENIVGSSAKMKKVFQLIETVGRSETTVLIRGESGTGKELVARAIHGRSQRKDRPFLAVNCAAFTETLLESELFGHAKGAFTGATNYRKGLFEEADDGTLFLDEIGETTPTTQVKLLRALQEGEIKPVGSNDIRKVEVRIVAATNRDLETAVKDGIFREDLYYRINVVSIHLPPLRDRTEDIPLLAHYFLRKYSRKSKKEIRSIRRDAMALLASHRWPGNVRELENVIERAVVLCPIDEITTDDLPEQFALVRDPNLGKGEDLDFPFSQAKQHTVSSFEKRYAEDVLTRAGGVIAEAARLADMDPSNFRRLLIRCKVDAERFKDS